MVWIMLSRERDARRWWFFAPEGPCWRGEIGVSAFGLSLVMGWLARREQAS